MVSIGEVFEESNCHTYTFVRGRFAGVSAFAGSLVAASRASTIGCGLVAAFSTSSERSVIEPDHERPVTLPPMT